MSSKKLDLNILTMGYLKKFILNCKQATFLIEKKQMGGINLSERVGLHLHLFKCSFCTLYNKQSRIINEMVLELFRNAFQSERGLDDGFKKQLQARIEQELNK